MPLNTVSTVFIAHSIRQEPRETGVGIGQAFGFFVYSSVVMLTMARTAFIKAIGLFHNCCGVTGLFAVCAIRVCSRTYDHKFLILVNIYHSSKNVAIYMLFKDKIVWPKLSM